MALAKEQYAAQDHVIPPAIRNFLESVAFGRLGLRAGRKIIRMMQKVRNPIQRKLWVRQFGMPLRNAMLLNRTLTVSFDGASLRLVPRGAIAGDF